MPRKGSLEMDNENSKVDAMINEVQDDGKTVLLESKDGSHETENTVNGEDPLDLKKDEISSTEEVKPTDKAKAPKKSYLSAEEESDDDLGETSGKKDRFIPVSEIQRERKKRQAIEQENAELKALIEKQGNLAGDDDLQSLIVDPDDIVDGKTVLEMMNKTRRQVTSDLRQLLEQDRATQQTKAKAQERAKQLDASEQLARKQFPDFDEVVSTAVDNGFLTPEELRMIGRSKNPGAILYRKSKEALSILGVPASVTGTQKGEKKPLISPEADEEDNIYSEVFNKKG